MEWWIVSAVFALAAAVQGLTGAGYALVGAPLMLIVAPTMVPVPLLLVSLILMIAMILRERYAIDLRALAGALTASFPGAAVGVVILAAWPPLITITVTSAIITVLAALALNGTTIPTNKWTMIVAGFSAGAMNSIAGIPGPPIILVYRPNNAAALRANLSLSWFIMSIFSVTMLYIKGIGTLDSLLTATYYLPAVVVGFGMARIFADRIHSAIINKAVLWLALLAGTFLFGRTVTPLLFA